MSWNESGLSEQEELEYLTLLELEHQDQEKKKCRDGVAGCIYWIRTYVRIYDGSEWVAFDLWPEQEDVVRQVFDNQLVIVLKARQLGLSWLLLAIALWMMLFRPIATILVFSLRENEAAYLLSEERMRGMYQLLPEWMCSPTVKNDTLIWKLANGCVARAFSTSAGDSYTASLAIVDEADLVPDLDKMLGRSKPTIDAGGKMVLISRSDKSKPNSPFKKLYRSAKQGITKWKAIFLAWSVRPERTPEWYEEQKADSLARTLSLDAVHEQYPATDVEALSPKSLDKRFPAEWLHACHEESPELEHSSIPAISGLQVFALPVPGRRYALGADPAEGNPQSDDSSLDVMDCETWEQVACLAGKFEPEVFGGMIVEICRFYNGIEHPLVERNNHGHAVLLALKGLGFKPMKGEDGKPGHLTTQKSKTTEYNGLATALREKDTTLHCRETYLQLANIEGSTLSAPSGEHDDRAMSYALTLKAAKKPQSSWHL